MTTMIERLRAVLRDRYNCLTGLELTDEQVADLIGWLLGTLREPTQAMVNAVGDRVLSVDPSKQESVSAEARGSARLYWRAMCDAILEEKP